MGLDDIRQLAHASPFHAFWIRLSDGQAVEVAHPDFLAIPAEGDAVVVYATAGGLRLVNLDQITEIQVGDVESA